MKTFAKIAFFSGILALAACSGHQGWKVDGSVNGAEGKRMAIEQNVNGSWLLLDSIDIAQDGSFEFTADSAAAFPDLYRLCLDKQMIYFPIDSLDHITIKASAADFSGSYTMSGSAAAKKIAGADSLIYASIANIGLDRALADSTLKVQLFDLIMADPEVMTAYYLISRNFNGKPLYDVSRSKVDYNMLRAVATKFKHIRPDDPRTKFLEMRVAQEMKRRNPQNYLKEIEAGVSGLPAEIKSVDINGNEQTLSAAIGNGAPALLSFAQYSADQSAAYTMVLQTIYDKYHARGLNIFQVSLDGSEPEWHRLAQNLPWTSVWGAGIKQGNPITAYNVNALPMTYIFDSEGNLVERVDDWQKLEAAIARYF